MSQRNSRARGSARQFLRVTLTGLVGVVVLAAPAFAVEKPDAAELALAKSLKADIQKRIGPQIPGFEVTKVTCTLVKSHKSGRCKAYFVRKLERAKGVYVIAVTVNTNTGVIKPRTLSVSCTDTKTGAPLGC
jgi:hypothetical protein